MVPLTISLSDSHYIEHSTF